jgi:hypothetical protein
MAPKKASATGTAALQPLDHNQETVSLREARSQKRKAVSPTPPEDEIEQEGLSTKTFIRRVSSMKMTGMTISIMGILFLMMLLLCPLSCRLLLGLRIFLLPLCI